MNELRASDVAKWFIQNRYDQPRNSKAGNMKLQKLLYFAQLVHLAKFGKPLFEDAILAFENGSVVEEVRQEYQYNHYKFVNEAVHFDPGLFNDDQRQTLGIVEQIFGDLSAEDLSDMNHEHRSWLESYHRAWYGRYHEKAQSVISLEQMKQNEVDGIKEIIEVYETGRQSVEACECVNGRKFFYDPNEITLTDDLLDLLRTFNGPDSAYTIYKDETAGVVIF